MASANWRHIRPCWWSTVVVVVEGTHPLLLHHVRNTLDSCILRITGKVEDDTEGCHPLASVMDININVQLHLAAEAVTYFRVLNFANRPAGVERVIDQNIAPHGKSKAERTSERDTDGVALLIGYGDIGIGREVATWVLGREVDMHIQRDIVPG